MGLALLNMVVYNEAGVAATLIFSVPRQMGYH